MYDSQVAWFVSPLVVYACYCSPEALGIVSGLVYVASLLVTVLTVVEDADTKVHAYIENS